MQENLLLSTSATINLYDINSNEQNPSPLRTITAHNNKIRVSWDPFNPNFFISGSIDKHIYLWDIRSNSNRGTELTRNRDRKIKHVAHDPHKEYIFAAADSENIVKLYDIRNQQSAFDEFYP